MNRATNKCIMKLPELQKLNGGAFEKWIYFCWVEFVNMCYSYTDVRGTQNVDAVLCAGTFHK